MVLLSHSKAFLEIYDLLSYKLGLLIRSRCSDKQASTLKASEPFVLLRTRVTLPRCGKSQCACEGSVKSRVVEHLGRNERAIPERAVCRSAATAERNSHGPHDSTSQALPPPPLHLVRQQVEETTAFTTSSSSTTSSSFCISWCGRASWKEFRFLECWLAMRIPKSKISILQNRKRPKIGLGISTKLLDFDFWILQEWCLLVEQCNFRRNTALFCRLRHSKWASYIGGRGQRAVGFSPGQACESQRPP